MRNTVVVQYTTKVDAADENQRLVAAVFTELSDNHPDALQYLCLRLDDGRSFLHIAVTEDDSSPLQEVSAFNDFQVGIAERVVDRPMVRRATLVGAYRVLGDE